ncbi:hypothetical protein [Streptomyces sp. NPDC097619]|uniref:hypothetical protein n=1 Tax=Streptomyces sp. NPDC097619 TaxID=3157228 RepID=UPI00332EA863
MPTVPNSPARQPRVQPPGVVCLDTALKALAGDARRGTWTATPLERRIAELLSMAAAGGGLPTVQQVRAALWEGAMTLIQENGGRFAALLADLVTVLEEMAVAPDGEDYLAGYEAARETYGFITATAEAPEGPDTGPGSGPADPGPADHAAH